MLQKLSTVPALGAVLLLSTAALFVQKPQLGVNSLASSSNMTDITTDPSSQELFKVEPKQAESAPVKLASAVQKTIPSPIPAPSETPAAYPESAEIALSRAQKTQEVKAPAGIDSIIRQYAAQYNADPEMMIIIAKCESGFRADAVNGPFGGMYQFLATTWKSNRDAMGLSSDSSLRFDAIEAIKTAAFKMGRDGYSAWPDCSTKAQLALN